MTPDVVLDSYVAGSWDDLKNRDGLFAGQRGLATNYGKPELGGLELVWDGSAWRLAPGAVLASFVGSAATPVDNKAGPLLAVKFALPGSADIAIPDSSIADNSRICVRARVKRHSGTNSSVTVTAWLGTANTTGDSVIGQLSLAATANHVAWLEAEALFSSASGSFYATGTAGPQTSGLFSAIGDKSTNVNRAAVMKVNIGLSVGNSGDSFDLIDVLVWVA